MFNWLLNMPLLPVKNREINYLIGKLKILWPLFMDGVQLTKAYSTVSRQFTFYH